MITADKVIEIYSFALVGDKGYLSQKLFKRLFVDSIQLITKIRKNMKKLFDVELRQNFIAKIRYHIGH